MEARLVGLGLLLVLAGTFFMLMGMWRGAGRAEGGGVVLIGPFPIAFGTSEGIAKTMLALGVTVTVFLIALHLLLK
jgi:uncharacterized membrane protein